MYITVGPSGNTELDAFVAAHFMVEFPEHEIGISDHDMVDQIETDDYKNEDNIRQLAKSLCDKYFSM